MTYPEDDKEILAREEAEMWRLRALKAEGELAESDAAVKEHIAELAKKTLLLEWFEEREGIVRIALAKEASAWTGEDVLDWEKDNPWPVEADPNACPECFSLNEHHKMSCSKRPGAGQPKLQVHVPEFIDPETGKPCNHGTTFDEAAAKALFDAAPDPATPLDFILGNSASSEIRKRWPRFHGHCARCGFSGIYYASRAHYIYGDY